jgi:hypothetical protein
MYVFKIQIKIILRFIQIHTSIINLHYSCTNS